MQAHMPTKWLFCIIAAENKSVNVTGSSVVTKDKKFMQIPFQPKDVFHSDFFFFLHSIGNITRSMINLTE